MKSTISILTIMCFIFSCSTGIHTDQKINQRKIPVIFDTDANNELDDQHAIAYLLFNGNSFDVKALTVNATYSGGNIDEQYKEAERIIQLVDLESVIPLFRGADRDFNQIKNQLNNSSYDGAEAIDFIIEEARKMNQEKIVVVAVGKLTNVALALHKDPEIIDKIKVVWLGSNYPEPGEYNLDNDTVAMNYVLNTKVEFEMATVRYGKPSGTDAVRVTKEEINKYMTGKGPVVENSVTGRHGGNFNNFGDYSINLFEHIEYYGDPPSRALYDMAAVAILKNPSWAEKKEIKAPVFINNQWVERPNNLRKIIIWENFDRDKIMQDFYSTMDNYVLVQ